LAILLLLASGYWMVFTAFSGFAGAGLHVQRTNRETINQLWDILDDPHLNKALGLPQNSRMTSRRSRF
jgi:hypothetical protein